jgi:hypothetical protein
MGIESIVVICLITLVVLIVQIIVTLRLFLNLHVSHRKDEEHGLQTLHTRPEPITAQDDVWPLSRHRVEALTVPGPVYPASSRYSVQTDNSDSSFGSEHRAHSRAPRPWDGTRPEDRRKGFQGFHSDSGSESGIPSSDPTGRVKKQDILTKVWARKP